MDKERCRSRDIRFGIGIALFGLASLAWLASFANAQQPFTDYTLNTPYVCPNDTSYTFTQRKGTGYFSMCYYTIEKNGRVVGKEVSACRQMTGYLRGCKLQAGASSSAPGAPVENWHSQPTNPAYLAAMPYVEQVRSEIKGSNPDDTQARQLTVFSWIPEMITQMREASRPYGSPWTKDETRITYAYNLAAKQITDDYAKTHTPQQTSELTHIVGHYEMMDDQFYKQWTAALFPADFLNDYNHAFWGMLAKYKAHVDQERKQNEEAAAKAKAAQKAEANGTSGLPTGPGYVAARRCMELGGNLLQCLGKGMSAGVYALVGMSPPGNSSSSPTGLTLTGVYTGGGISTDFGDEALTIAGCGNLVKVEPSYTVDARGDRILIHVQNQPAPFDFVLDPDGRLVGPGSTEVKGQIITGYRHYWVFRYNRYTGVEVPGSRHEVTEAIYAPKTERCSIATLAPTGRSATNKGMVSWLGDMTQRVFSGQDAGSAMVGIANEMPLPGIRMQGPYASSGGLKAEFETTSVVLDCGEAHVRDEYSIERTGSRILVHIQNSGSLFTESLQPDGSLSGPASVDVAGRLATGVSGTHATYTPTNAVCSGGRLYPHGAGSAATASASSSPVESTPAAATPATFPAVPEVAGANAVLSVTPGFPVSADPLAGKWIFLMKKRFDVVLRANGAPLPPGATVRQAWDLLKQHCAPPSNCTNLYEGIAHFYAAKMMMPRSGPGVFSPKVPAGTYYVMTATFFDNASMLWDVPVNVRPGENSVTLSDHNREPAR